MNKTPDIDPWKAVRSEATHPGINQRSREVPEKVLQDLADLIHDPTDDSEADFDIGLRLGYHLGHLLSEGPVTILIPEDDGDQDVDELASIYFFRGEPDDVLNRISVAAVMLT